MTMKSPVAFAVVVLLFSAAGCGSVTVSGDGGSGGSGATGGSTGTGGKGTGGKGSGGNGSGGQGGAHLCGPDANCSRCNGGACCGSTCCGQGEWCDTSGSAPLCRCGSSDACKDGNACMSPLGGADQCGVICCQGSACPVSRRAYKRDVHALDRAELDRVYAQLREIKLTTYRYKDEPPSAEPRLGFIIDDTNSPYPINPDGNSVNLYGYASMAVAAIQAQGQEIAALKAELAHLRRQVATARGTHAKQAAR